MSGSENGHRSSVFRYQNPKAWCKLGWAEKEEAAIILNSTSLAEKAIDYMKDKKLSANLFWTTTHQATVATNSIKSQVESTDFRHT